MYSTIYLFYNIHSYKLNTIQLKWLKNGNYPFWSWLEPALKPSVTESRATLRTTTPHSNKYTSDVWNSGGLSAPRMMLLMNRLQTLSSHVGVDLGGRDVSMT